MKAGFYPKLAWNGISKNRRFYLPYILTCVGMVSMYYIVSFLSGSSIWDSMRGSDVIKYTLELGSYILAVFSLIFLFYTNSFIIRRRKKEFGLYNILGMGKWNIGRILFWETVITALIAFVGGSVFGVALSKFAELCLVNIIQGDVDFSLAVSFESLLVTFAFFAVIFLLIFLNDIRQIKFTNPASLLKSENAGEKPPRANWFFGIAGILLLGVAYYIAVTIKDPVSAMALFFVAVIMVIIGTYLIFISGSVMFCKILQKRKKYYYKPNHFVSVSSMVYRMKRNGAGLASICILATMVLVMISSTSSLYFGSEASLNERYPRDISVSVNFDNISDMNRENLSSLREAVKNSVKESGASEKGITEYRRAAISGLLEDSGIETDVSALSSFSVDTLGNIADVYFIPVSDYNRIMDKNEILSEDEVLMYTVRTSYNKDTFTLKSGDFNKTYNVKKHLSEFSISGDVLASIYPTVYLVVPDFETSVSPLMSLSDYNGSRMVYLRWYYGFDTDAESEVQKTVKSKIYSKIGDFADSADKHLIVSCDVREEERASYYSLFGGLFFLGILLSIVFIFAAVLIIYYKQISEGYEDQSRFEIMQKVGMTKKEIRKSINSQLLTVFFLPLSAAGAHLAFAFPMIRKILLLFNLNNIALFAGTTVISFVCFAVLYTFVYRITSNAYYSIVSGSKKKNG